MSVGIRAIPVMSQVVGRGTWREYIVSFSMSQFRADMGEYNDCKLVSLFPGHNEVENSLIHRFPSVAPCYMM